MDEDYDAVDLENWFLAMQSADGSVIDPVVPPAVGDPDRLDGHARDLRLGRAPERSLGERGAGELDRLGLADPPPRAADGHDASAFPDLVPDATGKITYDVDNDGDGITDSVWVDLGYPARRNAQGQLYKPLFAFMVIGLNGRIPLNTAGNLAGQTAGIQFAPGPPPATPTAAARSTPSTWATRSARSTRRTRCRTGSTRHYDCRRAPSLSPVYGHVFPTRAIQPGGQRRHRRPADPAPQPAGRHPPAAETNPRAPGLDRRHELVWPWINGDEQRRPDRRLRLLHAQRRRRPATTLSIGTDANGNPVRPAPDASGGGPVGRGRLGTRRNHAPGFPIRRRSTAT